jgi:hypothetical protein
MSYHVFIDNSNIFGGARRAAARIEKHIPWPAIRVHFPNLVHLIEDGQNVATRVLAGSVPPGNDDLWQYARRLQYNADLLRKVENDDGHLVEQGVDELLHLKIANVLLDSDGPEALVLGTGDGRVSTFGTGFALQAQRALRRGWNVEVWSWREQLSSAFQKLSDQFEGRLRIHELDRYYGSLTFVKGGRIYPPAVPKIVNVAERIVRPVPPDLRLYRGAVTTSVGAGKV